MNHSGSTPELETFDLDTVAEELNRRGTAAFTTDTGGNTYALYAGKPVLDQAGDLRHPAVVGPAFLNDGRVTAWREDCSVSPEQDDDVAHTFEVPPHSTEAQIADLTQHVIDKCSSWRARP